MPKGFWWGDLTERDHLERPGIYGRIILRCIFRKWDGGHSLNSIGSEQGQVSGARECGNEPSGSIKSGEFLE